MAPHSSVRWQAKNQRTLGGLVCRPRALSPEGRSVWQLHCSRNGRDRQTKEGVVGKQTAQLCRVLKKFLKSPHHSLVLHFTSKSQVRDGKLDLGLGVGGKYGVNHPKLNNSKARIKPRDLQ